jgi:hypothetical protein
VDKGHGRLEKRTLRTTSHLTLNGLWKGLKQGVEITRERTIGGTTTVEVVYGITSLSAERADAAALLRPASGPKVSPRPSNNCKFTPTAPRSLSGFRRVNKGKALSRDRGRLARFLLPPKSGRDGTGPGKKRPAAHLTTFSVGDIIS